jgi:hypothetical protein
MNARPTHTAGSSHVSSSRQHDRRFGSAGMFYTASLLVATSGVLLWSFLGQLGYGFGVTPIALGCDKKFDPLH